MAAFQRIALIGFGEVGKMLAGDFARAGVPEIAVFDILFSDPKSAPSLAAAKTGIVKAASAAEAAKGAGLIVSAVTAAATLDAAKSAAPGVERSAYFLDLNSASPGMKRGASEIVGKVGGRYVEAAVMTPIAPKGFASAMLFGGPHAREFLETAKSLGSTARVYSEEVGRASAVKMCRSVLIKGMEALLTESMLAARHYGVEQDVLGSLGDLLPNPDWNRTARYMISRSLEHGKRRAEEVRESARTVEEAGVAPTMSRSIAERQDWAATQRGSIPKSVWEHGDMVQLVDALIAARAK